MARTALEGGFGNKQLNALPSAPIREQSLNLNAEMFGGGAANSFNDLAKATGDAGNAAYKIQQERDVLEATNLDTEYQKEVRGLLYDPDQGYLARQSGNAIGVGKEANQRLEDIRRSYLDRASGEGSRQLFFKSSARTVESTMEALGRFELSQQQKYRDDTIDARILNNANRVATAFNDDNEFAKSLQDNNSAIIAKASAAGASPDSLIALQRDGNSKLYAARAASMLENPDPETVIKGADFLENAWLNENVSAEHYARLSGTAREAKAKAYAKVAYGELSSRSGGAAVDADASIATVLKNEGGYVAVDGASGAPAIYGINRKWHAEAHDEAKRITEEQGAAAGKKYAAEFYKREYWDKNNIDALPQNVRTVVMDAAVNHRTEFVQELVEAAKTATPQQLVKMRLAEYERLAREAPEKYAASLPGWKNRLMDIAAPQGAALPQPIDANEAAIRAQEIERIAPGSADTFLSMVDKSNKMVRQQNEDYVAKLVMSGSEIMAASNGDISAIPADLRAQLQSVGKWDDVAKYSGVTDSSILFKLRELPEAQFATTDLRQFAPHLSREDLLHEQERQKKIQTSDEGFKTFSRNMGNYWVQTAGDNKNTADKAKYEIRAEREYQRFVDENKRAPNPDESRAMLQSLLLDSDNLGTKRGFEYQPADTFDVAGVPVDNVPYVVGALDKFGFEGNAENIESFVKNPSFFVGAVPNVPPEQVNAVALQLVANRVAVTPANITAVYNRALEKGETITPVKPVETKVDKNAALLPGPAAAYMSFQGKYNPLFRP